MASKMELAKLFFDLQTFCLPTVDFALGFFFFLEILATTAVGDEWHFFFFPSLPVSVCARFARRRGTAPTWYMGTIELSISRANLALLVSVV
jgi:hypothetical protein